MKKACFSLLSIGLLFVGMNVFAMEYTESRSAQVAPALEKQGYDFAWLKTQVKDLANQRICSYCLAEVARINTK
jgi:hypothetical protein